jgi:hypothetical protein
MSRRRRWNHHNDSRSLSPAGDPLEEPSSSFRGEASRRTSPRQFDRESGPHPSDRVSRPNSNLSDEIERVASSSVRRLDSAISPVKSSPIETPSLTPGLSMKNATNTHMEPSISSMSHMDDLMQISMDRKGKRRETLRGSSPPLTMDARPPKQHCGTDIENTGLCTSELGTDSCSRRKNPHTTEAGNFSMPRRLASRKDLKSSIRSYLGERPASGPAPST